MSITAEVSLVIGSLKKHRELTVHNEMKYK